MQIKCIDGYKDYDLSDDRFPKMICNFDRGAIHERYKNPNSTCYELALPVNIPHYKDISIPHLTTRTSSDHACFLCDQNKVGVRVKDQNKVGRPKKEANNNDADNICNKCFFKLQGKGRNHKCSKSKLNTVSNITNKLEELSPKTQDQVIHSMLKSKLDPNQSIDKQNKIKLHTTGHKATIQVNPSTSKSHKVIKAETLDQIRTQANLSINQTKLLVGGIQSNLGRKSTPPNYINHASKEINLLKDFFNSDQQNFITETKDSLPIKYENIWTVWAPMLPLIQFINNKRNNTCSSNYIIKIMGDSGQGKTKICFCVIPIERAAKKSRASYAEGGILSKGSIYSGVNKCIMCFCCPQIKEDNWNLKKIFNLIGIDQVFFRI